MTTHPLPSSQLATLIVSCPDRSGLVAALAQFLTASGENILDAEQHRDDSTGLFFQRIEFDMTRSSSGRPGLERGLRDLAAQLNLKWQLFYGDQIPRVALFVSKVDHCLYDLILRQKERDLPCEIALIVSNHDELRPVAEQFQIPYHHIPVTAENKTAAEAAQLKLLRDNNVDTVILARYMQILSPAFVGAYESRLINIHHSFLPAFAGGKPYHQALEHGVKLIGATSHYVTSTLDEGPIIEQDVVRVSHRHSLQDLVALGRDVERLVLARAVKAHLEHRVAVCGKKTIVFS